MQTIGILTDSTAYLSPQMVERYAIHVLPLNLHWNGKVYRVGVDIRPEEFYRRLSREKNLPTTSQPSIQEFARAFGVMAERYKGIVAPLISSGISGTVDNALNVAREFKSVPIEIVDTRTTSAGQALVVLEAARAAAQGRTLQEVHKVAEQVAAKIHTYFVVDTLEYLHRGGRIGGASRYLGTALKIKPVLYFNAQGKIDSLERVRTKKKALQQLISLVAEKSAGKPIKAGVIHTNTPDIAFTFREQLAKRVDCQECFTVELSPVIGTHVGPGTIGIAFYSL